MRLPSQVDPMACAILDNAQEWKSASAHSLVQAGKAVRTMAYWDDRLSSAGDGCLYLVEVDIVSAWVNVGNILGASRRLR